MEKRSKEAVKQLEVDGFYDLTLGELSFGVKLAWRNAPRCAGRIHWRNIQVFDFR